MAFNLVEELRVRCPNKGCNFVGQKQHLHHHVQNECEEVLIPCVYAQYGCPYTGKRREQESHTGQCIFDKLKLMLVRLTFVDLDFDVLLKTSTLTFIDFMFDSR